MNGGNKVFSKLKSLFYGKNSKNDVNRRISEKLHNMPFKYISEKDQNGTEIIVARAGHINIEGENKEFLCATEGVKTVFKLEISKMSIWEFMSLDGCVINFKDVVTGNIRNVIVYYDKHLT